MKLRRTSIPSDIVGYPLEAATMLQKYPEVKDRIGKLQFTSSNPRERLTQQRAYENLVRGAVAELQVMKLVDRLVHAKALGFTVVGTEYADDMLPGVDIWVTLEDGTTIPLQVKSGFKYLASHTDKYPAVPVVFVGKKSDKLLKEEIRERLETAYAANNTRREDLMTKASTRPCFGNNRSVRFEGNAAPHKRRDLVEFERLLLELCAQIKLGGDLVIKATGQKVYGKPDLRGLSVNTSVENGNVPLFYQPGGNGTRYKYYLCLHNENDFAITVANMLKGAIQGAAYLGQDVDSPDAASATKVDVVPELEVVTEVVTNTAKPAEPPAGGYLKNDSWRVDFLNRLHAIANSNSEHKGFVSKDQVYEELSRRTHFESAHRGYGILHARYVQAGWLVRKGGTELYRVERENPIFVRAATKPDQAPKAVAAREVPVNTRLPVNQDRSMYELTPPEVMKVLHAVGNKGSTSRKLVPMIRQWHPDWPSYGISYALRCLVVEGYLTHPSMFTYERTDKPGPLSKPMEPTEAKVTPVAKTPPETDLIPINAALWAEVQALLTGDVVL